MDRSVSGGLAAAAGWQDPAVLALAVAIAKNTTAVGQAELARGFPSIFVPAPPGVVLLRAVPSVSASRRRADLVLQVVCQAALPAGLPIHRPQLLRELRGAQRRRRRADEDRLCTAREQRRTNRALTAAAVGVALVAAGPDTVLRHLLEQSLSAVAQASLEVSGG